MMSQFEDISEKIPRAIEIGSAIDYGLDLPGGFPVIRILDQTELPAREEYRYISDRRSLIEAIETLAVRGAPALGVAGACGVALVAAELVMADGVDVHDSRFASALEDASFDIAHARPTAVNLKWGVDQALRHARMLLDEHGDMDSLVSEMIDFSKRMIRQDEDRNRAIGRYGADLLSDNAKVLTHCNAGSLATAFYGTALGVIYTAFGQGKIERVFSDETRPLGQGARLTVWELSKAGVPVTLICDDMAAFTIEHEGVDAVIVGADRIAANGDTANKIGTCGLAIIAQHFDVPFYVAAPSSTIDIACESGAEIPIEMRSADEVLPVPIEGVDVLNPAFDVTPHALIAKIITEDGAFSPQEISTRYAQDR